MAVGIAHGSPINMICLHAEGVKYGSTLSGSVRCLVVLSGGAATGY
jgi:hypothetical protein